jgi:hypothetical protein
MKPTKHWIILLFPFCMPGATATAQTIEEAERYRAPESPVSRSFYEEGLYLPDFSFAGYHFGEKQRPRDFEHVLDVASFGATPDDGRDDSDAFIAALDKADELDGFVLIRIPSGRFDLSKIIYLRRSKTVVRGSGAGSEGTVLYFQRPLRYLPDPPEHVELNEYLVKFDKRQREPQNGVDIPYSQYSWSGGYLWVAKEGARFKPYFDKYNRPSTDLAKALAGRQGSFTLTVDDGSRLLVGETYQLSWFNKDGENGSLLKHIYDDQDVEIGSHHWTNPDEPLVNQKVLVTGIEGNTVTIKDPLLHDIRPEWSGVLSMWERVEEVGIENLAIEFPLAPELPHHVEQGYNAIYLTGLLNGWLNNIRIENSDSGVLTDGISNVTIENIRTHGDKTAHYSVSMGEVHNVLVRNLRVENKVRHPLSFNTRSTRSVYTDCAVEVDPILDQHSGANEQNLFDNIRLYVDAPVHRSFEYPLFESGGAGYWAPAHGAFTAFYNIALNFANVPAESDRAILLNGVKGGVSARIIGVHANHPVTIDYGPNAYIEKTNEEPAVRSLYEYQLDRRLSQ